MINPESLEKIVQCWLAQNRSCLPANIATHGKTLKGAKDFDGRLLQIVTMISNQGEVIAQTAVQDKSNEIPAVRTIIDLNEDLNDVTVSVDAMHTQTARAIVMKKGGEYVMQVKDNQKELSKRVHALLADVPFGEPVIEKNHGRIEQRAIAVLAVTPTEVCFPHAHLIAKVHRIREMVRNPKASSKRSIEPEITEEVSYSKYEKICNK